MLCLMRSILVNQATPWNIIGRHRVYILQSAYFFVIGPATRELLLISVVVCIPQGCARSREACLLHVTVQ